MISLFSQEDPVFQEYYQRFEQINDHVVLATTFIDYVGTVIEGLASSMLPGAVKNSLILFSKQAFLIDAAISVARYMNAPGILVTVHSIDDR